MGRRSNFSSEHRDWIADQLLRSSETPRSPEVWRALYTAFLEQFPDACDVKGEAITQTRYKSFAIYTENRQETSLVSRVAAHLRRHELLQRNLTALVETRPHTAEPSGDNMADADLAIKSEVVDHSDDGDFDVVVVPRAPAPLLRTRATAIATRDDKEQHPGTADPRSATFSATRPTSATQRRIVRRGKHTPDANESLGDTLATPVASTVGVDSSRKRPRVEMMNMTPVVRNPVNQTESSAWTEQKEPKDHSQKQLSHNPVARTEVGGIRMEAEKTTKDTGKWKSKYEAEKKKSEGLQARLNEALSLISSQAKQIERLEATIAAGMRGNPVSTLANTPDVGALTFTIRLDVDVSQNGQRLQTTTHALRVDTDAGVEPTSS